MPALEGWGFGRRPKEGWSQGEKGRREGLRPTEGRGERAKGFVTYSYFQALEKELATHSSVLAWRIPGTGEPGGLPSMGSHRVGHD